MNRTFVIVHEGTIFSRTLRSRAFARIQRVVVFRRATLRARRLLSCSSARTRLYDVVKLLAVISDYLAAEL